MSEQDKTMEVLADLQKSFEGLKGTYDEKLKSLSGVDAEKVEAMQKSLDDFDVKNAEATKRFADAAEKAAANEKRVADLEEVVAKTAEVAPVGYKETAEYKALHKYATQGDRTLSSEEIKTLRTDVNGDGGFLVPVAMASEIIKEVEEISPVRQYARIRTMASKTLDQPIRKTLLSAAYEGENEEGTTDNSTYGNEQITPFRQTVTVPITRDMLMDAAFDMSSEITSDVAESFAQGEGRLFVTGDGVKKPQGILEGGSTGTTSAATGVITLQDLILLEAELKQGYNPLFFMNKKTLAALRIQETTDKAFVWIQNGSEKVLTINGIPYAVMQDMPDTAVGNVSAGVGDLKRGYHVFDRTSIEMIRDDVTAKKNARVEFTFHRWNTGRVILPEAIKLLTIKS